MDELSRRSGISKSALSFVESGRVVPTSDEFDRVMAALAGVVAAADTANLDIAGDGESPQRPPASPGATQIA